MIKDHTLQKKSGSFRAGGPASGRPACSSVYCGGRETPGSCGRWRGPGSGELLANHVDLAGVPPSAPTRALPAAVCVRACGWLGDGGPAGQDSG